MNKIILKIFLFFILSFQINSSSANEYFKIEAGKLKYNNEKNIISAEGNAIATHPDGRKITANIIIYNKNKNTISTRGNSIFLNNENKISANNFFFNLNNKILEARKNVVIEDAEGNKFFFNFLKYNQITKKSIGEKGESKLKDNSYLKADVIEIDNSNNIRKFKNTIYTTCKDLNVKNNKPCPSWSMKSKETIQDLNKNIVKHKNAFLRIKNLPVLYSPYLSHPDPSVSRQSGFLAPMIKTITNIGRTVNIPYYWVVSADKDVIFEPVYFFNQHPMLKTNYRQAYKNGKLKIENAYTKGYKNINKSGRTNGSRNYIFAEFDGKFNKKILENNNIKIKYQRVSQQNFLRVNKLNGDLFKEDIRSLENSFHLTSFDNNRFLSLKAGIFENLDMTNSNKYTYFFPDGQFSINSKKFNFFNTNFNSFFQGKKFSGNEQEGIINNDLKLNSKNFINNKFGTETNFKFYLYNRNKYINTDGKQNNLKVNNNFSSAFDVSLPVAKIENDNYQIIRPKVFLKYTTGSMQDARSNTKILNFSDIYSMNRTNNESSIETGASAGYGFEYLKLKKKSAVSLNDLYKFNMGFGQVTNLKREENMPITSSLNNKNSDFAGFIKYNYFGSENNFVLNNQANISFLNNFKQNGISINYNFNLDNDFSKFNRNKFMINSVFNTFYTALSFEEKSRNVGNSRSAELELKKVIDNNFYITLNNKKNLKNNSKEYEKVSFNYENDCIVYSLSFSKNYYSDKDLSNTKSLIFGVVIKPFSDNFGPDLTEFIN